jgi:hypothetical protein
MWEITLDISPEMEYQSVVLTNDEAMKLKFFLIVVWFAVLNGFGQGLMQVDQQSADENTTGEGGINLATNQPLGQSFTPTLSAVDFVSLQLSDVNWGNGTGATVYVELLANSITNGTPLDSTAPVFLPDGFGVGGVGVGGITNFFFPTSVSLTPGTTYYLRPVLQSGDPGFIVTDNIFHYSGGTAYANGAPMNLGEDLWFREGVIVPEPTTIALVLFGSMTWLFVRRRCG